MRKAELARARYEIVPVFARSHHHKPRVRKAPAGKTANSAVLPPDEPTPVVVPPNPVPINKWGRDDTLRERYPRWKGGPYCW
jgi:hypothetical protein